MKLRIGLAGVAMVMLALAGAAQAQDMGAVYRRIDQLENEVQQLRARVGNLGHASASPDSRSGVIGPGSAKGFLRNPLWKAGQPDGAAP